MTRAPQFREIYGQVLTYINYCTDQEKDNYGRVAASFQTEHLLDTDCLSEPTTLLPVRKKTDEEKTKPVIKPSRYSLPSRVTITNQI